jgi:hypothetical protein
LTLYFGRESFLNQPTKEYEMDIRIENTETGEVEVTKAIPVTAESMARLEKMLAGYKETTCEAIDLAKECVSTSKKLKVENTELKDLLIRTKNRIQSMTN